MSTQPTRNSIKVANPAIENQPRTYLTQDVASSATTISVASISGFPGISDSDFYVLIGDYGDEKAEIRLVDASATSGKDFTITALTSSHEASDPVTLIAFNQVRYFGLSSSDSTTYNLLETKDIDPTSQFTEYSYTGTTYGYFASAYYHSNSDEISGYSEIIDYSSFTRRSTERIIKSGALKALTTIDENPNSRLTWDIALTILQDGLDEIGARKKRWAFWNTTTTGTTTTANQNYIAKPTDLTQLIRIKIDGYQLDWLTVNDYNRYTDGATSSGTPSHYTELNGKYYLYPTPSGAFDIEYNYFKVPDVISNMSTEIDIPLVPVLIYYCGSQFAYIRGNDKKGDSLYKMYTKLLEEQVEEYSGPMQDGVAEYVERTSAYDDELFIGLTS
jgi:hypothetical protein